MPKLNIGHRQRLGLAAAALIATGAAGGAGAVALTRPAIEMAPTIATPIARLPASSGIVTVKGRVAEVYGDRVVVQDGTGRTMIDAGRDGAGTLTKGAAVLVQGRYDDGQLRAHFLVGPSGQVEAVGPAHRPPHGPGKPHGPGGPGGPGGLRDDGPDGPPPPPPVGTGKAPTPPAATTPAGTVAPAPRATPAN